MRERLQLNVPLEPQEAYSEHLYSHLSPPWACERSRPLAALKRVEVEGGAARARVTSTGCAFLCRLVGRG